MDALKKACVQLSVKNLLAILALAYFITLPWNRYTADAFWLLLAFTSLIYIIVKKYRGYDFNTPKRLKNIYWLFVLIPTISLVSYLFSPLETIIPKSLEPDTRWLLIIPIMITLRDKQIEPKWITTFLAAYAISTFISAGQETHWFTQLWRRADGGENAVPYGMFNATLALMLLTIFISPYIKQTNTKLKQLACKRVILFTLFILAATSAFLSGTRAAVLLIPIVIAIIYLMHYPLKKAILGLSAILILGVTLISIQPGNALQSKLKLTVENTINFFQIGDRGSKLTSAGQRLAQWQESWCIFTKHPILGTGPRSFRYAHFKYGHGDNKECNSMQVNPKGSYQAHSVYFNTLSTLGIIGILTFSFIFVYLLKTALSAQKSNNPISQLGGSLLFTVLACHAINGLTLDLWFLNHMTNKNTLILVLPLLLIFAASSKKLKSQNRYTPIIKKYNDHLNLV